MQALEGITQPVAQFAGSAFVATLWQGTLLAAAVWLCLHFAPRATAALRFALWTVVLLLVCLLPLLEAAPRGPSVHRSLLTVDLRWSLAITAVWLAVSLLRATNLAWHTGRLWRLHRRAIPVHPPETIQPLLTSHRRVQLCTSHEVERPGVIGFFAPRILIPTWLYPQLTVPELEQIVLHEVEHLRRRDDWFNLLQKLALVLFPLNPALIAVERLLCRERELACDDGVLRRTHAPRRYAACLATLAERGLDRRAFSLALGALGDPERRSELGRRIQRILRRPTAASPLQTCALSSAVCFILAGGATVLARCPLLVSFVPAQTAVATAVPSSPSPARTMQVVYAEGQPGPRLMTTSFSSPRKLVSAHLRRRRPIPAPQAHLQKQMFGPEASLLLSAWPEQERPRLLTLGADLPVAGHFAVVRVEGGWLLVQL